MRELIVILLLILTAKGIAAGVQSVGDYERRRWAEQCDKIDRGQAASLAGA